MLWYHHTLGKLLRKGQGEGVKVLPGCNGVLGSLWGGAIVLWCFTDNTHIRCLMQTCIGHRKIKKFKSIIDIVFVALR